MRPALVRPVAGIVAILLAVVPAASARPAQEVGSPTEVVLPIYVAAPIPIEYAVPIWPLVTFRQPAPTVGVGQPGAIPGQYMVFFDSGLAKPYFDAVVNLVGRKGGRVHHVYEGELMGFAATMPLALVPLLQTHPYTSFIEADQVVSAFDVQPEAAWGLDRIDHQSGPLDNRYTHGGTGVGVTAYVLDTGIRPTHTDFGSRVHGGYSTILEGRGSNDCNGHGTHVAGTIGGRTYGVAKQVQLVAVRVLGCDGSGSSSGLVAGIDWVTKNHASPAVANMSVGSPASQAVDEALKRSIASGVTYVAAAGNSNQDACASSPARYPDAITVGATSTTDTRAPFSNWGGCVDVFAPGVDIRSAWHTGDNATNMISGTSMATPHVTGAAALYLQRNPTATPAAVHAAVVTAATPDVVKDPAGSPNRLLFSPV